jgi:hypothetical protein
MKIDFANFQLVGVVDGFTEQTFNPRCRPPSAHAALGLVLERLGAPPWSKP